MMGAFNERDTAFVKFYAVLKRWVDSDRGAKPFQPYKCVEAATMFIYPVALDYWGNLTEDEWPSTDLLTMGNWGNSDLIPTNDWLAAFTQYKNIQIPEARTADRQIQRASF